MRNFRYFDPLIQLVLTSLTCSTILVLVSVLTALTACKPGAYGTDEQGLIMPPQDAAGTTTCPVCALCTVCTEDPNLALEFFGDGRDGDFIVPAAATFVLQRDMFWHDLIFPPGSRTIIDPNGFAIMVSGTLRGPGTFDVAGKPHGIIQRDGRDSINDGDGAGANGYSPTGTIGRGGSGNGGNGSEGDGGGPAPGLWYFDHHPSNGGSGGGAGDTGGSNPSLIGSLGTIAAANRGSSDVFSAIRMQLIDGTPIGGGAGGAGGVSAPSGGFGGGGGAGGGNIVVLANHIENATSILVSSRGGKGGDGIVANAGGGGGGTGGYITMVTFRLPFPILDVTGGLGGHGIHNGGGGAEDGTQGSSGVILPFHFVL